jgi:hypothetical protein
LIHPDNAWIAFGDAVFDAFNALEREAANAKAVFEAGELHADGFNDIGKLIRDTGENVSEAAGEFGGALLEGIGVESLQKNEFAKLRGEISDEQHALLGGDRRSGDRFGVTGAERGEDFLGQLLRPQKISRKAASSGTASASPVARRYSSVMKVVITIRPKWRRAAHT